jgi:hypothetical protein
VLPNGHSETVDLSDYFLVDSDCNAYSQTTNCVVLESGGAAHACITGAGVSFSGTLTNAATPWTISDFVGCNLAISFVVQCSD